MALQAQPGDRGNVTDPAFDTRLAALAARAAVGAALHAAVLDIARSLGFESFSYMTSPLDASPRHEECTRVWTTLPGQWVALYERMRYADVDPRLTRTWNRTAPCTWDAAQSSAEWQVQQFLRDAAAFGIRSGVVVSLRDARYARAVVALNSSESPVSAARRLDVQRRLGDIMLLATTFHDLFMAHVAPSQLTAGAAHAAKRRLSQRERQCLQMAARGLTSADIGTKLGITARTANFHFSNVISKLGVLNRHEAIARAVSTGMISLGSSD